MKFLLPVLAAASLSSCATKFTEAERQSLATVAIAPTKTAADAYKKPDGGSAGARQAANQVGASGQGGAIGGALASLIGEGISAVQNSNFHKGNGANVAIVERNTPHGVVGETFQTAMTRDLKNDPFFSSRLQPSAPSVFNSTVTHYGLVRSDIASTGQEELRFCAEATVQVILTNGAGKRLLAGYAHGASTNARTIGEYAGNPAALKKDFQEAAAIAESNFREQLATKTAK